MSPEAVDIAAARAEAQAIRLFDAWWGGEIARMRRAHMAAPRAKDWQGPPFLNRQFHGTLSRSLYGRASRAKLSAQIRYLVARAERRNGA